MTGDIFGVSDPTIIKAGDTYYIFSSGPGIPVRRSNDLRVWEGTAPVFTQLPAWAQAHVPAATAFWAPDISFRDGRYWLYYSVSTLGSRCSAIGLATNATLEPTDPAFNWEDRGLVWSTQETDDYNAIDPNAVEGPSGTRFLAFGSFWTGLKIVELDPRTGKPPAGAALTPIASRPGVGAIEGACIARRGEFYYLFCSHDFTGRGLESTYKVVVGRSRCVTGPFVDRDGCGLLAGGGTRVIANSAAWRGPGHNALLQDGGLTWIVYHALHPTRRPALTLRIDRVVWTEDGWPEVPQPPPPVTGYWEHRVAARPARLLRLLPDGSIDVAGEGATWRLVDSTLELHWSSAATSGPASVDRCTVSADRRTYAGRDAAGRAVQGRRSVLGWWEHRVADGPATMLRLLPNGTINDAQGGATWVVTGDVLEMRWPNTAAPGGSWIDRVQVLSDRGTYAGQNQLGIQLSGWQVASE